MNQTYPEEREQKQFSKTTLYSPGGHLYQINYANNASKNSRGTIAISSNDKWYIISKKQIPKGITEFVSITPEKELNYYINQEQKVFILYFGHLHEVSLLKSLIGKSLVNRSTLLGLEAPNKDIYLADRIARYNFEKLLKMKPSGVTSVVLLANPNNKGFLVKPSNKIHFGSFFYEGGITSDEVNQILNLLHKQKLLDVNQDSSKNLVFPLENLHMKSNINLQKVKSDLRDYNIFVLDSKTWVLESV
jgi:hypothetical protein